MSTAPKNVARLSAGVLGDSCEIITSIILSTRDRADLLVDALESILADTSAIPRELIVVDNDSRDGSAQAARAVLARSDIPSRVVVERRPGLSHVRNRGVAVAHGKVLAFTDDDVLVADGWADALTQPFLDDPKVGVVGGRIKPQWSMPPPPWFEGPHAVVATLPDFGPTPTVIEYSSVKDNLQLPAGANFAVRASALADFDHPFDLAIGTRHDLKLDNEETLLLRQLAKRHRIVYRPDALLYHRIPPHRIDHGWLRRCWFQKGFGYARAQRLEGEEPRANLYRRLRDAAGTYRWARRLRRQNLRSTNLESQAVDLECIVYFRAGREFDCVLKRFPSFGNWVARHLA